MVYRLATFESIEKRSDELSVYVKISDGVMAAATSLKMSYFEELMRRLNISSSYYFTNIIIKYDEEKGTIYPLETVKEVVEGLEEVSKHMKYKSFKKIRYGVDEEMIERSE